MEQLIIGLITFFVIILVKANQQKNKKAAEQHHGENFPFPPKQTTFQDFWQDIEEEEVVVEKAVFKKPSNIEKVVVKPREDAMNFRSVKHVETVVKTEEETVELEIDPEKLIIYSEVMAPRFDKY